MKKILSIGLASLFSLSYSGVLGKHLDDNYYDKINNINKKSAAQGKKFNDKKGHLEDDYYDSVIWYDIYAKTTHGVPLEFTYSNGKTLPTMLATPVDDLNRKFTKEENILLAKQEKQKASSKKPVNYFVGGYCIIPQTIQLSKGREFTKLNCTMNFGKGGYRPVSVFAALYPDYKKEEVYAIPLYAELPSGNRATFNGVVLNDSKTSANVADWVDNARLRKLIGEGALAANDIAYKYINGYLQAKAQSRTKTEVHYIQTQNGNNTVTTPVETQTVKPPKVGNYLIGAGVELLSKLFSIKGKDYLYSSNPLFIVNPKKVYVEGVLLFDNAGLAKRFGTISQERESTTLNNNNSWKNDLSKIINTYGNTDKNKGVR